MIKTPEGWHHKKIQLIESSAIFNEFKRIIGLWLMQSFLTAEADIYREQMNFIINTNFFLTQPRWGNDFATIATDLIFLEPRRG